MTGEEKLVGRGGEGAVVGKLTVLLGGVTGRATVGTTVPLGHGDRWGRTYAPGLPPNLLVSVAESL
jgi:hypothetical protein